MDADGMRRYVEATADLLDLPVTPERMEAVLLNFARLAGLAALVNGFDLGPADEAGPVWRP